MSDIYRKAPIIRRVSHFQK